MTFQYGFGTDSRQLIEDELGFGEDELEAIEEDAGFSLSNTFDTIEETDFEWEEAGGTASQGLARTTSERTMEGVDVVLEYDDIDAGTLAHEAVHAKMKQPEGDLFEELPDDATASQRLYAEFVAYLAEDRVDPLDTDAREGQRLRQAEMEYRDGVDLDIEEAYDRAVEGDLGQREAALTARYQDAREQDLAAVAAESYNEQEDVDMTALMSPDAELYKETMAYIETVEDAIEEYT